MLGGGGGGGAHVIYTSKTVAILNAKYIIEKKNNRI